MSGSGKIGLAAFYNFSRNFRIPRMVSNLAHIGDIEAKVFKFSAGEQHVKILNPGLVTNTRHFMIGANLADSEQIMQTLLMNDAIRGLNPGAFVHLFAPYFPYARQDVRAVTGEPLSVKVMAKLINSQNFASVTVIDPHSGVTPALIDRINVIDPSVFIRHVVESIDNPVIVSPDAGAEKRIAKVMQKLSLKNDVVHGYKKRDLSNGNIVDFGFIGNVKGRNCLIVDDIIDAGWTFIKLAEKMKQEGAANVYVYATHSILSQGIGEMKKHIDRVYTTDTFINFFPESYEGDPMRSTDYTTFENPAHSNYSEYYDFVYQFSIDDFFYNMNPSPALGTLGAHESRSISDKNFEPVSGPINTDCVLALKKLKFYAAKSRKTNPDSESDSESGSER